MDAAGQSLLQEIDKILSEKTVSSSQARECFYEAIDFLLSLGKEITSESRRIICSYFPIMEELAGYIFRDDPSHIYARSVLAYIKGDFREYLKDTEQYFQANREKRNRLDWYQAKISVLDILEGMPTLKKENFTYIQYIGVLGKYAERYYPESAFGLYCKFLCLQDDMQQQKLGILKAVLDKDGRWALAWMDQGDIFFAQEQWQKATHAYKKALEDSNMKELYGAGLHFGIAYACSQLSNLGEAISNYKVCIELAPDFTDAYNNLGYCLNQQKKDAEAEKYLKCCLQIDEKFGMAWSNLGDVYVNQKKWAEALKAYENALELEEEESPYTFFQAAWCAEKGKDLDKAIKFYKSCVELDPAYPFAYNNLGYALKRKGDYQEAEACLRQALEYKESIRYASRNLFDLLEKQRKMKDLYTLIQQYSKNFQTKFYQDKIKKYLGQVELAERNGGKETEMELQDALQQKTENSYAGTIRVAPENSNIRLYAHQVEAIRCLTSWKQQKECGAGLLVLPTGGGKTLTAFYWLIQNILNQGGKVLWIAHRHELLAQAIQSFQRVCYHDLSPNKAAYHYRLVSGQHDRAVHIQAGDDLLIASKGSLARNLQYIQQNWVVQNRGRICMVIDEAHHATAGEYRKVLGVLKESGGNFRLLGLTATPFRTAEKEQGLLKKQFPDDILYKIDLRTLIERGILSEPIFRSIQTQVNMAELFHTENADELLQRLVKEKGFDLDTPGSLGEKAAHFIAQHSERNRFIVDTYVKNQDIYGKTLVFVVNVDMAVTLNALFQDRGIRSEYIVSGIRNTITGTSRSAKENAEILRRFREGELDVLVNVIIVTEGIDLPEVQTVFLTRPTKSKILMTQMIGRALRGEKAGGTAKAYIVSFLDDWQEYIAWVNPEKLFIDTNADFNEQASARETYAMRLVSIAKIEEFARLADETIDSRITDEFSFLERIPVGLYQFSYLPEGDEETHHCTVLVYDCMQKAYQELMQWLEGMDPEELGETEDVAGHVDSLLFGKKERLLGYHKQDIYDIVSYYRQTGILPQWIRLEERAEYDVSCLAQAIIDNRYTRWEEDAYIEGEWNQASEKWKAFFGYDNINAFQASIDKECRRLMHPERFQAPKTQPITKNEEIRIQDLPLGEIHSRYPEIGEKLRNAVFEKYQDANGYYYSAESGYRSKRKLDFQIDHIKPMAHGGLTVLENLQLLTRQENAVKGAIDEYFGGAL